jgi:hypothetical protein
MQTKAARPSGAKISANNASKMFEKKFNPQLSNKSFGTEKGIKIDRTVFEFSLILCDALPSLATKPICQHSVGIDNAMAKPGLPTLTLLTSFLLQITVDSPVNQAQIVKHNVYSVIIKFPHIISQN